LVRDADSLKPYRNLALLCSVSLFALALVTGWWAVIRSNDLQLRNDNARNLISARYVKRGSFLDRNDQEITSINGSVGNYIYNIQYPSLSNTIGYYDYTYGTSNLEDKYNDYLSGQKGYPSSQIWFNYLLYNQPLPGRNVKLTLDLNMQAKLDQMSSDNPDAALIMNAKTGEILAISSEPSYNANLLSTNLEKWKADSTSPLLNRASQGSYPLGELITPFLISEDQTILQEDYSDSAKGAVTGCAISDKQPQLWSEAVSNGCLSALSLAAKDQNGQYITSVVSKYGLNTAFELGLPENPVQKLDNTAMWQFLLFGQNPIRVSPLQVAYAYSIFSSDGNQPALHILSAIDTQQGSIQTEQTKAPQVIPPDASENISRLLASSEISGWEISSHSNDANGNYSWYIAGTSSDWTGTPLILVMVEENANATDLRTTGRQIFTEITATAQS
jgi:cell division protein FtsI/penicillin-binding protein 2